MENKCLHCGEPVKNKYCNVSCQNRHQNPQRKKKRIKIEKTCPKCGNDFELEVIEGGSGLKERSYCSLGCANSIGSTGGKTKNSNCIKCDKNIVVGKRANPKICMCINCLGESKKTKNIVFESECSICGKTFTHKNKRKTCGNSCFKLTLSNGGKKSVNTQKESRRSKNEKHFAELCEDRFNKVLTNEPIFSGWDADVIIEDLKVAVLWNGKWHYEKITESHSVKQVQNRDKIKIKEIRKMGYKPYVIKDMGREDSTFVKEKFLEFLSSQGI